MSPPRRRDAATTIIGITTATNRVKILAVRWNPASPRSSAGMKTRKKQVPLHEVHLVTIAIATIAGNRGQPRMALVLFVLPTWAPHGLATTVQGMGTKKSTEVVDWASPQGPRTLPPSGSEPPQNAAGATPVPAAVAVIAAEAGAGAKVEVTPAEGRGTAAEALLLVPGVGVEVGVRTAAAQRHAGLLATSLARVAAI
eukprot:RCo038454